MSKTAAKIIPFLNKRIEALDNYSLNDRGARLKMASDVRQLIDDIPKQMKPLIALLTLYAQGVKAISEKSLTDYLAAIDAVADGFTAAEHFLNNGADRAKGMLAMRDMRAYNMAQNEDSCVLFGMPKEAIKVGAVEEVLPLPRIPGAIINAWGHNGKG